MKLIIVFFSFFQTVIYGQTNLSANIECKYNIRFQTDTTDTFSIKEEVVSLLIGGENSLFRSNQKVIYDSLAAAEIDRSIEKANGSVANINLSNIRPPKFNIEVFKNGDSIIVYHKLLQYIYSYTSKEKLKWKILNENKIISGFTCQKATTRFNNREYIAWFAKEIPFSDGPYIFKGLPGLVLEVKDITNYISFSLVQLKKVQKPIIPINSSIQTTHAKYILARTRFLENPVGVFESQTKFKIPPSDRDRVNKLHQKTNFFLD